MYGLFLVSVNILLTLKLDLSRKATVIEWNVWCFGFSGWRWNSVSYRVYPGYHLTYRNRRHHRSIVELHLHREKTPPYIVVKLPMGSVSLNCSGKRRRRIRQTPSLTSITTCLVGQPMRCVSGWNRWVWTITPRTLSETISWGRSCSSWKHQISKNWVSRKLATWSVFNLPSTIFRRTPWTNHQKRLSLSQCHKPSFTVKLLSITTTTTTIMFVFSSIISSKLFDLLLHFLRSLTIIYSDGIYWDWNWKYFGHVFGFSNLKALFQNIIFASSPLLSFLVYR